MPTLPAPSYTGTAMGSGTGDWSTGDKWAAGLGGGALLAGLMGTSDAYGDAQKQLQQYYGQAQGDMRPFIQAGQGAIAPMQGAAAALMDPAKLREQWLSSYQLSPEAKMEQGMATQQGLGAASSMGLLGSSPALRSIQGGTAQIGLQDQQNYLQDLMNKYTTGINVNKSLLGTGANLTGTWGEGGLAENMGNEMANMQYGKEESPWSTIGSLIGGAGGFLAGGGPAGMVAGAKLGGML